jgi:hypothetical protein
MKKFMAWEEAIQQVMTATGKDRRQALAILVDACRRGELPVVAVDDETGERLPIPKEMWPTIN